MLLPALQDHINDLHARTQGFIFDVQTISPRSDDAIIVQGRYDLERFTPALFDRLDLRCPSDLADATTKRKAEFLSGRCMARAALIGLGQAPAPIERGPSRAPIWPDGSAGSISHARGFCASFAISPAQYHCGVDIETIVNVRALRSINHVALCDVEHAFIDQQTVQPAPVLATLAFSAKETLFKALYPIVQAHFGFRSAELCAPLTNSELTLRLTCDLAADLRKDRVFTVAYDATPKAVVTWLKV